MLTCWAPSPFLLRGMCAGRSSLLGVPWRPTTNQRPRTHVRRSATRQTESTDVSSHGWLRMPLLRLSFLRQPASLCDHTKSCRRRPRQAERNGVQQNWLGDSAKAQPRIEGDLPGTHWLCLSDDQPIAGEENRPTTHSTSSHATRWTSAACWGGSVETRGSKKASKAGNLEAWGTEPVIKAGHGKKTLTEKAPLSISRQRYHGSGVADVEIMKGGLWMHQKASPRRILPRTGTAYYSRDRPQSQNNRSE